MASLLAALPQARRTRDRSLRQHKFIFSTKILQSGDEFVADLTEFILSRGGVVLLESFLLSPSGLIEGQNLVYLALGSDDCAAAEKLVKSWPDVGDGGYNIPKPTVMDYDVLKRLEDCRFLCGRGGFLHNNLELFSSKSPPPTHLLPGLSPSGISAILSHVRHSAECEEAVLSGEIEVQVSSSQFLRLEATGVTIKLTSKSRISVITELLTKFAALFEDEARLAQCIREARKIGLDIPSNVNARYFAAMWSISGIIYSLRTGKYSLLMSCGHQVADSWNRTEEMECPCGCVDGRPRSMSDSDVGSEESGFGFTTDPTPVPDWKVVDSDEEVEPWPYAGFSDHYLGPYGEWHWLRDKDEVVIDSPGPIKVMYDRYMPGGRGVVREVCLPPGSEGGFTRIGLLKALVTTCREVNPVLVDECMALRRVWLENGVYYMSIE